MNEPITRNENDVEPSRPISFSQTGTGHSGSLSNTWNINSPLPWICIAIAASFLAVGLAIGSRDTANQAKATIDATAFEAKRIAEREARLTQVQLDDLKSQLRTQGFKIEGHEIP